MLHWKRVRLGGFAGLQIGYLFLKFATIKLASFTRFFRGVKVFKPSKAWKERSNSQLFSSLLTFYKQIYNQIIFMAVDCVKELPGDLANMNYYLLWLWWWRVEGVTLAWVAERWGSSPLTLQFLQSVPARPHSAVMSDLTDRQYNNIVSSTS